MFAIGQILSSRRRSPFAVSAILTSLLASSFVVLGGATGASAADCSGGVLPTLNADGDTYTIGTAAELIALSTNFQLNGSGVWGQDLTFIQTANIDLGGCDWSPIGTATSPFVGTYSGEGFTVSGLRISSTTAADVGFFGFVGDGSEIQELTVTGEIDIPVGSSGGGNSIGAVAGVIAGWAFVSQVIADVDISMHASTGAYVGGLVGMADEGFIEASAFRGNLDVSGDQFVGGLVGRATAGLNIQSSYTIATFDVTGLSGYRSAGIVGVGSDQCRIPYIVINTYSVGVGQHYGVELEQCGFFNDTFYDETVFLGRAASNADLLDGVLSESTMNMNNVDTYKQNNWHIVEGWGVFDAISSPNVIWGICPLVNDGYPYLLFEYTSNPCVAQTAAPANTAPAAKALAKTGSTAPMYLALLPTLLAMGGLLFWLGRGRRSKGEFQ